MSQTRRLRLASLTVYGEVLRDRPLRVVLVLLANVLSTLFEGIALVLLIPLLELASGRAEAPAHAIVQAFVASLTWLGIDFSILTVIAAFAALAFLSALFNYLSLWSLFGFGAKAEAVLRDRLFAAAMGMTWLGFTRMRGGALAKTLIQDAQQAGSGVVYMLSGIGAALSALVMLVIALLLSWQLTLMTLVFGLIAGPAFLLVFRRGERSGQAASRMAEALSTESKDLFDNAKLLFSQGLRSHAVSRFRRINRGYRAERLRQEHQNALVRLVFDCTAAGFVAIFLLVTLWLGNGSPSVVLVFLVVFYRLAPRLANVQGTIFRAATLGTWLVDWRTRLAEAAAAADRPHAGRPPPVGMGIELRGVNVHFQGAPEPLLHDVSLRFPEGSISVLVGPSGQGKSTLLDVLTGLVPPASGAVLVGGVPLQEIDLRQWQEGIGLVLQENPILHDTVARNVAFAVDDPDDGKVAEAVRMAGAWDFVQALPETMETVVGERGSRLSGGQRQRLALARALYRHPRLLLLDEATSALDGESAERVIEALEGLRGRVTMVIVTHRKDVLALADAVYAVRDGSVQSLRREEAADLLA